MNRYIVTYSVPVKRGRTRARVYANTAKLAAKQITDVLSDAKVHEIAKIVAVTVTASKLVYSE